ncbi:MAG: hypothetical protein IPJ88_00435 [Myxococcales bacterium]|nr:MAG: hypothetical protein IPJ88_00435 [Myxococcales bacterium]
MNTGTARPPAIELEPPKIAEERLADLRRRRAEAADVLAETLLDIWLRERRARREAGLREPREGGRSA